MIRAFSIRYACAAVIIASAGLSNAVTAWSMEREQSVHDTRETVSDRLGGVVGIYNFLSQKVSPAFLADPIVGPYFNGEKFTLTESSDQINACFAMFLDHKLGGSSPNRKAIVPDPNSPDPTHICRKSMAKTHRGMNLDNEEFNRFVEIVEQQARLAGISDPDIKAIADVLEKTRGSILHK